MWPSRRLLRGKGKPIIGLCFSLPCSQTGLAEGKIIQLNKRFENPGAVGMDPVKELKAALDRAGLSVSPRWQCHRAHVLLCLGLGVSFRGPWTVQVCVYCLLHSSAPSSWAAQWRCSAALASPLSRACQALLQAEVAQRDPVCLHLITSSTTKAHLQLGFILPGGRSAR